MGGFVLRYGVIYSCYGDSASNAAGYNLGDAVQTIAVLNLYKKIGIDESEIVKIGMKDLHSYDGEYVLLPMIGVAMGISSSIFPFSPKIIPLFISSHFVLDDLTEEMVRYLNNYAPIGCRDEYSLKTMRKYHIPAYLSGCITTLFEKNKVITEKNNNIYLVDTPNGVLEKVKEKYPAANIIEKTHLLPICKSPMTMDETIGYLKVAQEYIDMYQSAKLVISSRLHALVPAMAVGTPVIGIFENISNRFSWVDKYFPLNATDDLDSINWEPEIVDYSDAKKEIEKLFISQVQSAFNSKKQLYDISEFYEDRKRSPYCNRYREKLKSFFEDQKEFDYYIWGVGLIGYCVYQIMSEEYPYATFKGAIDSFKTGTWKNKEIIKPGDLVSTDTTKIILANHSGKAAGYELMKKLNKSEFIDFIYVASANG